MLKRQFAAYRKGINEAKKKGSRAKNPYGYHNSDLMHWWYAGYEDYKNDPAGTLRWLEGKDDDNDTTEQD